MKNLTTMGLAIAAMVALSAIWVSTAFAVEYHSTSTSGTTYLTGKGTTNQVFKFTNLTVTCTELTAKAQYTGTTAKELTATNIDYKNCNTGIGQTATVSMNGCDYVIGQPTGASSPYAVTSLNIVCPAGKRIIVTAVTAGCTVEVGTQATTGTSKASNVGGTPKEALVEANVSKITYLGSNGTCGVGEFKEEGTYTGTITMNGFSDAGHTKAVDVFVA